MMMILRNLQAYRSIIQSNRIRLFSLAKVSCSSIPEHLPSSSEEKSKLIPSTQKSISAVNSLPSYLPEPTGVKSKLFDEFYLIYRLGFHQPLRMIQLIKMMQMMSAAVLTPYRVYSYIQGSISLFDLEISLIILSVSTLSLYLFGWGATRTICYIYTNRECDQVILTNIDFYGRRKNIKIQTEDIIPINDIETPDSIILPFKRYSTSNTLYYSQKLGQILDRPRFNRIFAGLIKDENIE